jgi:hypothetical protein
MDPVLLRFVIASMSALHDDLSRAHADLVAVSAARSLPLELAILRHRHLDVCFPIIEYSELVEMYLHRAQQQLLYCEDKDMNALFFQTVEVAFGLQDKHHELEGFDFELGERLGRLWLRC